LKRALRACIELAEARLQDQDSRVQRTMQRVLALLWASLDELDEGS
jgi:hypothetical protein